jgi:outer membrane murein-binding lipoprotein Lpp
MHQRLLVAALILPVIILSGCAVSRVKETDAKMNAQAARIKALQEENADLSKRLSETRVQLEQLKQWSLNAQNYQLHADELWRSYIEPKNPAHKDFGWLGGATRVVFRDANPNPVTMGADRVARAVRLLSTTMPLGPGAAPTEAGEIDYKLEFVGLATKQTVILRQNAAYFNGMVYFRPGLSAWPGTSMHAD